MRFDLLGGPEAGFVLFVELPDVVVLDREDHEAVLVLLEQRFVGRFNVGGEDVLHAHLGLLGGGAHGRVRG